MVETPKVHWAKAKIDAKRGALEVPVEHGDTLVAEAFAAAVADTDGPPWGEAALEDDGQQLVVRGLKPGSEEDVRDTLRAVLKRAAEAAEPARVQAEAERQAQALESDGGKDAAKEMQKRFRSFADDDA